MNGASIRKKDNFQPQRPPQRDRCRNGIAQNAHSVQVERMPAHMALVNINQLSHAPLAYCPLSSQLKVAYLPLSSYIFLTCVT